MNETLGQIVDQAMKQRGLKGYELAARLGKQPAFVSRLINDEIKETLPVADMEAIERELSIPQPVMLRALGYAIPKAPRPTYGDNRLDILANEWDQLADNERTFIFGMIAVSRHRRGLTDIDEDIVQILTQSTLAVRALG